MTFRPRSKNIILGKGDYILRQKYRPLEGVQLQNGKKIKLKR
jgi:hypothetical protein